MSWNGGAWKRTGRLSGADAGRRAVRVYICDKCGVWHEGKKPAECIQCGVLAVFSAFDSKGEAQHWATLQQRQRAGRIEDLRRQVPLDLLTIGPKGLPVKWSKMIVDYAFIEDGRQHYFDWKPVAGLGPDAALKLRCLEAQGIVVQLVTSKGEV